MSDPKITYDGSLIEAIRAGTAAMLGVHAEPGGALRLAAFRVPETAVHDFAQYMYLRNPNEMLGAPAGLAPGAGDLSSFLELAIETIHDVIETHCAKELNAGTYAAQNLVPYFPQFAQTIYQLFVAHVAGTLIELEGRIPGGYQGSSGSVRIDLLGAFAAWLITLVTNAQFKTDDLGDSFDNPALWIDAVAQIEAVFNAMFPGAQVGSSLADGEGYSFSPFPIRQVNFGLRLVYRQEWRPLGTQSGEIVRTIPLGPKQSERVSTKVVISRRESRTADTFTSTETSTEASSVARESTDVVEEASSSLKWHVDAEASANVGFVSAKLSAGVAGDQANASKETKSRLNETMQKTASKMRRDLKVVVSTERSMTEETTTSSEIVNPNDEVAVTYVYSRLQRQYEIQTTLAEVNSVVFVPERVPAWGEIDEAWIRKHDWILGKALLDPSFAADLAELAREPPEPELDDSSKAISGAAEKARDAIPDYSKYPGGGLPDLFSGLQDGYRRFIDAKRGVRMNQDRRTHRSARLIAHLRDNILHYMRAIWSQEDADQRLRRYARLLVPTRWTFVPDNPIDPAHPELAVDGEFLPDLGPQSIRALSDIINPAGPLGYSGNYAVYYLRGDPSLLSLHEALTKVRAQFVRFTVEVLGVGTPMRVATALEPRYREATYTIVRDVNPSWTVTHQGSGASVAVSTRSNDTLLEFDGIQLLFETPPTAQQSFTVRLLSSAELEDPELRLLRATAPLPTQANEATFFSIALLRDMSTYVPDVAAILPSPLPNGWTDLTVEGRTVVRASYHLYVLLKEHTRRFLLETNNLLLDLEVGPTPGLEQFKRLHRVVDVLKELEEVTRRQLDNIRRSDNIASGALGDPDIENVTVVGPASAVQPLVAVALGPPAPVAPGGGNP